MEYRSLRRGEQGLACDLFESYYGPGIYCTEPRYFDWLHRDCPQRLEHCSADDYAVLAAIDDDRVQGCICYVPTSIHIEGQEHSAVVTTESLARPDSGGVYGLLARRLVGRFDYCVMMGATAFLRDLFVQHLGASYRHEICRLLLVGDVAALRRILAQARHSATLDVEQLHAWAQLARRCAAGQSWVQVQTAAELSDEYWQGLLRSGIACFRRDPAWLEWRYFRHPHIDYTIISPEPSQAAGIAVVRCERLAELDCLVVRLLEFLPTPGHHEALAGAVARYMLDQGGALLDFFCAHDAWSARFPSAFVRPQDHRPYDIPYLLQPPEWRERRSINVLTTRNRRRRGALPELDDGGLYLTKGDGAQDIVLSHGYRSAHLRSAVQPNQS